MVHKQHNKIFREGSKTYYVSSRFFPKKVREDVFVLYGFVRIADNLVDEQPVDPKEFYKFLALYREALTTEHPCGNTIIDEFIELQKRKQFKQEWVDAFLFSMEHDLQKSTCDTMDETLTYIYGSAEVIGLFMAKILDLPEQSYPYARMLGRAMQYINFLRDINEDNTLGRRYLPLTDTSLTTLHKQEALRLPHLFKEFIHKEIARYFLWQKEAEKGYPFIPRRYRIPIMTAADMYIWTAKQILSDPFLLFEKQIKPQKGQIIRKGVAHLLGVG